MKIEENNMRFIKKSHYSNIKELYQSEKYSILVKRASDYLNLFPNDIQVRFMRSKGYRKINMFEEAINDLKYILNLEFNEYAILSLFFIYYHLNMYKEALEIIPILYEKELMNYFSISIFELVMKKQLGEKVEVRFGARCDYTKKQILNYDENETLKHIEKHTTDEDEKKSKFSENIDLNYLFDTIRKNIDNKKKDNVDQILEIHYFAINNIGYVNNINTNFIKVVVIPNTKNIITMYPTLDAISNNFSTIEIDYDKLFKNNNKVKTLSRIDKFNKKYNIN